MSGLLEPEKFGEYGRHHDGVVYDDLQKEGEMTEEKIKEWAGHVACDVLNGGPCIGRVQWHAERRDLARALLDERRAGFATSADLERERMRAEKAEAARDALAEGLGRIALIEPPTNNPALKGVVKLARSVYSAYGRTK